MLAKSLYSYGCCKLEISEWILLFFMDETLMRLLDSINSKI